MFYESYLEQEPELIYESVEELQEDQEDEYRQDRIEELANRFGGY